MPDFRRSHGPRDGARGLFFERLLAEDQQGDELVYGLEDLGDAIAASLRALFSVRAPASALGLSASDRRITDFGVAALENVSIISNDQLARYAAEVKEAVLAFEPRLDEVRIEIARAPDREGDVKIAVFGVFHLGVVAEPFHFVADEPKTHDDAGQ